MAMKAEGDFLFQKSVFLLISSVGRDTAETLIQRALQQMGTDRKALQPSDIAQMSVKLEPALKPFVGDDKAQRLASALRVLVGGAVGATE
jgi:hypothetical protein